MRRRSTESDERALALGRMLEQLFALDDGLSARRPRRGTRPRPRLDGAEPADDGCVGLAEAVHGDGAEVGAAKERKARTAAQHGFRLGAHTTTRLAGATEGEDALETAGSALPEGYLRKDVEAEQEIELRLRGQERGELEEPWITRGLAEESDPSGGEGEGACFRDGRSRPADVGLVQLERRSELDDRGRGVEDRGEVVADLAVATSVPEEPRTRERVLSAGFTSSGQPSRKYACRRSSRSPCSTRGRVD